MPDLVGSQVRDVNKVLEDESAVRMGVGLTVGKDVTAGAKLLGEVPVEDFAFGNNLMIR